jgi:hypothetical protein
MDGKLQTYDLLEMLILNLHITTLMMNIIWFHSPMGHTESFFWCKPMERYLTPHKCNTHISWVSIHNIIVKAYHTTRSLDPLWYILCASWVDQLESTILSSSWSTLYLLMLYQISLEMHREFFIWLHALSLGQPWLNSWDHRDLDIEPSLELFSCNQTLKIIFISSNRWSWCQCSKYILIFIASNLESNTWYSIIIYGWFLHIKLNENISP